MTRRLIARITGLIGVALMGMIALALSCPCWPFSPLVLTRSSEFVDVPELHDRVFAQSLRSVLRDRGETSLRLGSLVLVGRRLAGDQELRSKYTAEAVAAACSEDPNYKPPVKVITFDEFFDGKVRRTNGLPSTDTTATE